MSEPLVSVIVPNYNGGAFIEQALDSIVAQSYTNIEIIAVDDGSSDDSAEILEHYKSTEPRMKVVFQENSGVAVARNVGIGCATGDYIAFLDSDDYWHPEKLSLQIKFLEKSPSFAVCFSSFLVWLPEDRAHYRSPENIYSAIAVHKNLDLDDAYSGWIYHILLQDVYVWTGTVVIRREIFDEVGCFNEDLKIGEDHDLWLRIANKHKMAKLNFPTALYRTNPASVTGRVHSKNYAALVVEDAITTMGLKSSNGVGISKEEASSILYKLWFRYAYHCYWNSHFSLAHSAFGKTLKHKVSLKAVLYYFLTLRVNIFLSKWIIRRQL